MSGATRKAPAALQPSRPSQNYLPMSFLLLAQYGGRAAIPLEEVCRDFFQHLSPDMVMRKIGTGELNLVVTRIEPSQKAPKVVLVPDLADYLDRQNAAAKRELAALNRP